MADQSDAIAAAQIERHVLQRLHHPPDLRLQRLRDNNWTACPAYNNVSTDFWPNTLYDTRQALMRDVAPAGNALRLGGSSGALQQKLASFVTAYNNLVGFVTTQISAVGSQDHTTIGRDTVVRQIRNTLKSSLTASYTNSGAYDNVSQIGLEFTQTGTLQRFRPGIGLILQVQPVPVVPTWIVGSAEALPIGQWRIRRHPISVTFGEVVTAEVLEQQGVGEQAHERIATGLHACVEKMGEVKTGERES